MNTKSLEPKKKGWLKMTNNEMALEINMLSDDDFIEVFFELSKMHGLETIDEFTEWLNTVLHEIESSNVEAV